MQLRVLGCVDIVRNDQVSSVPGARRRSVLATLALRPDEVVSFERIIDAVWAEAPPATARNTVQAHVAALRKLIGVPGCLVNRSPGYILSLPEPSTDLAAVRGLLARAKMVTNPIERLPLLRQALTHWRGAALADVAASPYLSRQANSLGELRTTTQEDFMADQLRLGQHQSVIPELETLCSTNPYRERPVRLLMTALFRDGRTADALAAYHRLSELLADELGVVPGRLTTILLRRIRRSDASLLRPPERYSPARPDTHPQSATVASA
jgi:DNA-binding SARP family transcriptional activator